MLSRLRAAGIFVTWCMLLLAWALAVPHGAPRGADRVLAAIWCVERDFGRCWTAPGSETGDEETVLVPAALLHQSCVRDEPTESAACLDGVDPFGTSVETPIRMNDWQTDVPEMWGVGPPPYIRLQARVVSSDVESSLVRVRSLNLALAAVVPALAFGLARRRERMALVASGLLLAPLGFPLLGSVDTASWTLLGALVALPMLVTAMGAGSPARRAGALIMGCIGLLLLSTPLVMQPMKTGLYVVIAAVLGIAIGGLDRNPSLSQRQLAKILILVAIASSVARTLLPSPLWSRGVLAAGWTEAMLGAPRAVADIIGGGRGPSWEGLPLPIWVQAAFGISVLALVGAGLRRMDWARRAVVVLVPVVGFIHLFHVTGREGFSLEQALFSGRHLLPLAILFVGATMLVPEPQGPVLARWFAGGLAVVVFLAHGRALFWTLARYVAPEERRSTGAIVIEWWWAVASPGAVWALGVIALGILAVFGARLLAAPLEESHIDSEDGR